MFKLLYILFVIKLYARINIYKFFAIPLIMENTKLSLALVILTGSSITVVNEAIEKVSQFTDKTSKV